MPPITPPLDFNHKLGYEIPMKYKEAIRQLYDFTKVPIELLIDWYHLSRSIIVKVLDHDKLEHIRRKRGSAIILSDKKIDEIIEDLSTSWDTRVLD
jgi:hypothetical protein